MSQRPPQGRRTGNKETTDPDQATLRADRVHLSSLDVDITDKHYNKNKLLLKYKKNLEKYCGSDISENDENNGSYNRLYENFNYGNSKINLGDFDVTSQNH